MSGPLVTGQTSISSNLVSMDFPEDEFDEGRIESRAHRQIPESIVGECRAFYRVLLGHQNRARAGEVQVFAHEKMMIGEWMTLGIDAELTHQRKEALGMRDAGHRVNAAGTPFIERRHTVRLRDTAPRQRLEPHSGGMARAGRMRIV